MRIEPLQRLSLWNTVLSCPQWIMQDLQVSNLLQGSAHTQDISRLSRLYSSIVIYHVLGLYIHFDPGNQTEMVAPLLHEDRFCDGKRSFACDGKGLLPCGSCTMTGFQGLFFGRIQHWWRFRELAATWSEMIQWLFSVFVGCPQGETMIVTRENAKDDEAEAPQYACSF